MQAKYKMIRILRISTIAYNVTTVLFFLLTYISAGFFAQEKTTGIYGFCITLVNVLVYVVLYGFFVIIGLVFYYFVRIYSSIRISQEKPEKGNRFPTVSLILAIVFFMLYISMMNAVLN